MWHCIITSATIIAFCNIFAFGYSSELNRECPSPEDIQRCFCKETERGLDLKCRIFNTDDQLTGTLRGLKGYAIHKLLLSEYNATTIPTDLFQGNDIEDLSIEKFEVEDASFRRGKKHFQGLENSLETLEIRKSFRTGGRILANLQLDHLKKLETIILEDNSIPEVGNDWFSEGPSDLVFLLMEKNGIEELGARAFSSLVNLKMLAVAGNHFHSISRSMLPAPATQLYSIDLAHNKLRDIPKDLFNDMPSLQEINLSYNVILTLQEAPAWFNLQQIHIEGNPLQCDQNLKWICSIKLHFIGKCALPPEINGISLLSFCQSQAFPIV